MTRSDKARVSKQIIRAWFDTVLIPIAQGLEEVEYLLKNRNLTWKRLYRDFEDIKPLESYVPYQYMPNYEQLIMTKFPELQEIVTAFDQKRAELSAACGRLFDKLSTCPELERLFWRIIGELEKNGHDEGGFQLTESDINYLKSDNTIFIIAEYMLNDAGELDHGYTTRPIWNYHREEFFKLLSLPLIRPEYVNMETLFEEFQKITVETRINVKVFINFLSLSYGVPIVEFKNY